MNQSSVLSQKKSCSHCGEDCPDSSISLEIGENFCCEGCKVVFQLLRDNNLCAYYDLDSKPGISFRLKSQPRFDYLDNPEIQRRLIDFSNESISKVSFYLPQMHCASCLWLLEKIYKLNGGIIGSEVNFLRKEITLTFNHAEISLRGVVELLTKIGYEPEIRLNNLDKAKNNNPERDLYLKLGLAGFAFGNTMMLSFPEYLSLSGGLDENLRWFFGILNIALATPVLLYSARDYFISLWYSIRERTMTLDVPIAIGLIALYIRSIADILTHSGSGFFDSFSGLVFFLLIGKLFQKKTFETLAFDRDYKSYFPLSVSLKKSKGEESIPVSELQVGDIISVRNKELIPADGILLSQAGHVDYSFVTGEAEPFEVLKSKIVYAGGRVTGAAMDIQIVKEVSQSYLTRLWNNDIFKKEKPSTFLDISNRFGKWFTIVTIATAVSAAIFWLPINPTIALNSFTAVLIIACPCALWLAAPFSMGWALTLLGKSKFYLKNASVVLDLAKIDTIVFDKTGTLTNPSKSEMKYTGKILTYYEESLINTCLSNSTHPLSRRIASEMPLHDLFSINNFEEFAGLGVKAEIDGHRLVAGSHAFVESKCNDSFIQNAKGSVVCIGIDGEFKGYFTLVNIYRFGLSKLFDVLKENLEIFMLSGDNDREKQDLLPLFSDESRMYFSQSPEDKMEFIKKLREQGKIVAMVGDGLNDAGALQQSNMGIAISENTASFSPACDAVLSAEQLHKIPDFITFAKHSKEVIWQAFLISVVYNFVGLGFAVSGTLSPLVAAIFMPVSSLSMIIFTTASMIWKAKRMKIGQ